MKQIISILLCIMVLCSLWGCEANVETESTGITVPNPVDSAQLEVFNTLFDIRNTVTVQLDMEPAQLAKMQEDYNTYYKSPIYRKANLRITITTPDQKTTVYEIPEVGVRMKGNTSRTDFYNEEEGIYNLIHLKISFQETFDDPQYYGSDKKEWTEEERQARKNRTFATLEKMDLRWNRCDDSTYLKEFFAYETYREYGVLAPHVNLCSFDWAGIHMGVYTINEPVDKIFLAKNLPAEALGGDLYKIGWVGNENGSFTGTNSIGIEDEETGKFYAYDLKTNKKTSQHQALIGLIQALNQNVTKDSFAKLVDLDRFLPYCAVSYLLGNPDDLRNNYNNCYIYFRADNGKMMIIPYDYDRCLGVTAHWNPTGDGVTSDNPFSTTVNADGKAQYSPLFLYSVVAGGFYVREYASILETIANGSWFTQEKFAAFYQIAQKNYAAYSKPGKEFYNTQGLLLSFDLDRTSPFSDYKNISIREYLDAKRNTLAFYLSDLDKYAEGSTQRPTRYFIRCDKTNWQNDDQYAMESADGMIAISLRVTGQIRLKIYDDQTGKWYGTECIAADCSVAFDTDDHTNIVLQAGTYRIIFDPVTEIVTLEKEAQ